jgi:hypothetical protein
MDNFFRQQGSDTRKPGSFIAGLQIAAISRSIIKWLVGLVQLTEEEQKDAGINYPDDQYK